MKDVISFVDVDTPEIGEGLAFRGAALPFGMIMFGPNGGDDAGGYSCFTLQGAEVSSNMFGHVAFHPMSVPLDQIDRVLPVPQRNPFGSPGYFHDRLPEGIEVELTVTPRTGFARFTYLPGALQVVRFDATKWEIDPTSHILKGYHEKGLGKARAFFVAEFDHEIVDQKGKALLFKNDGRVLMLKVALSYVSIENALANLKAENSGWNFSKVKSAASRTWEKTLSKVKLEGGDAATTGLAYTCLYRSYLQPNLYSDVNGEYRGFDDQVHLSPERDRYASYSVWDIYRTWVQLLSVLEPKKVGDMMQTLVDAAKQGGGAMPRWATINVETGIMEEASSTPLVASAYAFGARNFDLEGAWEAMNRVESVPGTKCQTTEAHPDMGLFLKHGFMPQGDDFNRKRAASFTLEYGMAAFTLAEYSKAIGKTDVVERYMKQSQAWKHHFNPATGYLQGKNEDGSWFPKDFDPAIGHFVGFTEGNSAQYTWTVRHNMKGLIEKVGGREKASQRLDFLFKELNARIDKPHLWIGNEPSFTIPWAYYWCGQPWKTQDVIHRILTEVWKPGLIPGADDLGAFSSWYVWTSIGLFPAIPGTDVLLISAPQFRKVTIQLGNGKKLVLATEGEGRYVQGVSWNGKAVEATWMHAAELMKGGVLMVRLSKNPGEKWGTKPDKEPPSYDMG